MILFLIIYLAVITRLRAAEIGALGKFKYMDIIVCNFIAQSSCPGVNLANVHYRNERHRSFRSEGPKGRNRKERCSSGLNDPARPTVDRTIPVPDPAGKAQIQIMLKPENFLSLQPLRIH